MDEEYNRMRWASRRGMLELDLVLGPFMDEHYQQLDEGGRAAYRELMACEDQDMYAWLLRGERPEDTQLCSIVETIVSSRGA